MADAKQQNQVVSAARFYINAPGYGQIALSEISGINSKVGSTEYIYNDERGNTHHTKQFGKTEPPVVTVKRALDLDGNNALLAWHAGARAGEKNAVVPHASLNIMPASGSNPIEYILENAWVSELNISPMKAGDGQVTMIEAKISCENILSPSIELGQQGSKT